MVLVLIISFESCKSDKKSNEHSHEAYQCPMRCEGDKTYSKMGSCPVCKMDLALVENNSKIMDDGYISDESIFHLTSSWNNEEGKAIQLADLKGKTLVVVMIYTTCKAACPRLVADMRHIEAQIPDEKIKNIQFIMVSIDPETDTPERLSAFAKENELENVAYHVYCDKDAESGILHFTEDNNMDMISIAVEPDKLAKLFQKHVSSALVNHVYHPVLTFKI